MKFKLFCIVSVSMLMLAGCGKPADAPADGAATPAATASPAATAAP